MTKEAFEAALHSVTDRRVFRPFTLRLADGRRLEVDHPRALAVGRALAIHLGPQDVVTYLDHTSVVGVVDDLAGTESE